MFLTERKKEYLWNEFRILPSVLLLTVQVRVILLSLAIQKDGLVSLTNSHLKPDVCLDKNQRLLHLGVMK